MRIPPLIDKLHSVVDVPFFDALIIHFLINGTPRQDTLLEPAEGVGIRTTSRGTATGTRNDIRIT